MNSELHDYECRVAALERQLKEWCEWHLMARYDCTPVQARRIVAGSPEPWPADEPSDKALVMRTIRHLNEDWLTPAARVEHERLRELVRTLVDEDPNADAADGVSVLDVWRKDARKVLGYGD